MTTNQGGLCSRCEVLPHPLEGPGQLYVWPPLGHSQKKLETGVREGGWTHHRTDDGCLVIRADDRGPEPIGDMLAESLGLMERQDGQALWMSGNAEPGFRDFSRVTSIEAFIGKARSGWLLAILEEERLVSWFQPIVHAADPSRIYGHEALVRAREADGSPIFPGPMFQVAAQADLLFQLDLAARLAAVRCAGQHGLASKLFINFSPASIYDPVYCLRSTVKAVRDSHLRPDQVVFEVVETEESASVEHLKDILDQYRAHGFRVALDDLGAGYGSLNLVHRVRPDIVKLDMDLIRDVDRDPYKAAIAAKLLEVAGELGIDTVAEGIETRGELEWARDHGATWVQGYLLAKPAEAPRTELPWSWSG